MPWHFTRTRLRRRIYTEHVYNVQSTRSIATYTVVQQKVDRSSLLVNKHLNSIDAILMTYLLRN